VLEISPVAAPNSEYAEQIAKNATDGDLADVDPPARKRTARRERRTRLLGSMAESVVHGSPTLVGQHLVCEVYLLEPFMGGRVARMQVGVALASELFERALDLLGRGISSHSEDLVVVPLLHEGPGGSSTRVIHLLAPLVAALWVGACKGGTYDPTDTATSPQAQAEPTPLAASPVASTSTLPLAAADAGPAPESLRFDSHLPTDTIKDQTREQVAHESPRDVKEVAGYSLQAFFRSGEAPPPARAGEINLTALDAARRKTEPRLTVETGASRARIVLNGGFVLPVGTELRSRSDRYGHLLLWPGDDTVRVVQPGALRALLGERRLDIAPLSPADARSGGDGPHRLNMRTRRVEISTRAAKATFELAAFHDLGEGGILICRFLLDLMSAAPATRACGVDELPLHAELRWTTGGVLVFDASSVQAQDVSVQDLAVPPPAVTWVTVPLPVDAAETLIPKAEIAAFHSAPVDIPSRPQRDGQAPLPDTGLALVNSSDELRIAWLEGVPIAWVGPGARLDIAALLHGRYSVQWRTFLGDAWEPVDLVVAPGTSDLR
jgi:hypothetical protein